jgi:hypothetical protein
VCGKHGQCMKTTQINITDLVHAKKINAFYLYHIQYDFGGKDSYMFNLKHAETFAQLSVLKLLAHLKTNPF